MGVEGPEHSAKNTANRGAESIEGLSVVAPVVAIRPISADLARRILGAEQ